MGKLITRTNPPLQAGLGQPLHTLAQARKRGQVGSYADVSIENGSVTAKCSRTRQIALAAREIVCSIRVLGAFAPSFFRAPGRYSILHCGRFSPTLRGIRPGRQTDAL